MNSAEELLTHRDVTRAIRRILRVFGYPPGEIDDGMQDVYIKAILAVRRGSFPAELGVIVRLCKKIAHDHAVDAVRMAEARAKDCAGHCDPSECAPLHYGVERRDPVDTRRQLEVLADLFRDGKMPEHGVAILEGVASRCSSEEMARELGITAHLVKWRVREMRRIFRARLAKLGLFYGAVPIRFRKKSLSTTRLARLTG